ncbi:MAG: NAD-dependent epimerase/dehydratase [Microgenomates group bacterium Gr01-1014_16]|nr:MAG: NAD-dependent epimerase/dehydratase [Microgenomates group bacterium Gr01-1014_16]
MKTLAVIGGSGMLGSDLVQYFSTKFLVTPINKDNYQAQIGKFFDIVINANGNSKRFWANQNPVEDFLASSVSVIKSIFDFPCDVYIYISSPDVYENHTGPKYTNESVQIDPKKLEAYGFHKHLAELIVKKYKEKFLILRSSMLLGKKLKKGPIYDVIKDNPLYITLNSKLQLITTFAIAEVIEILLNKSVKNEVFNVGGEGAFSFLNARKIFKKKIQVMPDAKRQLYEMDTKKLRRLYPSLKTSEEYLCEYLLSRSNGSI